MQKKSGDARADLQPLLTALMHLSCMEALQNNRIAPITQISCINPKFPLATPLSGCVAGSSKNYLTLVSPTPWVSAQICEGIVIAPILALSIDTLKEQRSKAFMRRIKLNLANNGKRCWACVTTTKSNRFQTIVLVRKLDSSAVLLYATAAKSFRQNSGTRVAGDLFAVEIRQAAEADATFETLGGRLSSTVVIYKITKQNVLTLNPINTDFALAAGEVSSRGLKLDVAGKLSASLRLFLAYAYTNAKVTKDSLLAIGTTLLGVPKQSANLLLVKDARMVAGIFSIGGGLNDVGSRNGDVAITSSFNLFAYTTLKPVSAITPNKNLRLSSDVDNLLDKKYWASSYQQTWVNSGAERRVAAKVQYKFYWIKRINLRNTVAYKNR